MRIEPEKLTDVELLGYLKPGESHNIHLGGYSTAEQQIKSLEAALEADLKTFEKLAAKLIALEKALNKIHGWPSDDPQVCKEMKLIAGYALADNQPKPTE